LEATPTATGTPGELGEVRRPLLQVGVATFLRFLRQVIEQGGVAGQLLDAGQTVIDGVATGLDHAQGQRRVLQHLPAPGHRLLLQLVQRHHRVDQTHGQCLLGVVLATQEPDLPGLLLAHAVGQQSRAVAAVEGPHPRSGLAEPGIVGRDGQVADHVQDMTAADGVAGHHGHHRFGCAPDLDLEVEDVQPPHPGFVLVPVLAPDPLVAARTEGLGALAGEDDHPHLGIVPGGVEGVAQFEERPGPEGVPDLGPADGDLGHPLGRLIADIAVVARSAPGGESRFFHRPVTPRVITRIMRLR
jgi:hypothetical protein